MTPFYGPEHLAGWTATVERSGRKNQAVASAGGQYSIT
jgi:hypothetical protein